METEFGGRTDRGNNNIPELSLESAGIETQLFRYTVNEFKNTLHEGQNKSVWQETKIHETYCGPYQWIELSALFKLQKT